MRFFVLFFVINLMMTPLYGTNFTWNTNTNPGLWRLPNNWSPFGFPDAFDDVALFTPAFPTISQQGVVFSVPVKLESLQINNPNMLEILGNFEMGIMVPATFSSIFSAQATHFISGDMNLQLGTPHNFTVGTVGSSSDLAMNVNITGGGGGASINFTGASGATTGTLRLGGPNTYDPSTPFLAESGVLFLSVGPGQTGAVIPGDMFILNNIAGATILVNTDANGFSSVNSNVTLGVDGTLNITSNPGPTVRSLIFELGGTLTSSGGGALNVAANGANALTVQGVSVNIPVNIVGSNSTILFDDFNNGTATLAGNVNIFASTTTFNIENGTAVTDMNVTGGIVGTGGVTKVGAGTLEFGQTTSNTYSGTTTVSDGTLVLNKTGGAIAIAGNLTVDGGDVRLDGTNQIANTSTVIVNSGIFDLNGNADIIGSLVFNGGTVTTGGPSLSLTSSGTALAMRDTTLNDPVALLGSSGGVVIFAPVNNGQATLSDVDLSNPVIYTFNIVDGTAPTDMEVTGVISGPGGLAKLGGGLLEFSGAASNTYLGTTSVNAGTLALNKTAGLNAIGGNAVLEGGVLRLDAAGQIPNTASMTINGGTFDMNGNAETLDTLTFIGGTVTDGGATLSLAGTGTALTMRNTSLTGQVDLIGGSGGNVVFDATNNGTASIAAIDLGGVDRIFNIADGSNFVDMVIGAGTSAGGGFDKQGLGTLQLQGIHTYGAGSSNVSSGALRVDGDLMVNAASVTNGSMIVGGTLTAATTTTVTNGSLVVNGDLTAASTIVTGGSLRVDGTLTAASIDIQSGGQLSGTGTLVGDLNLDGTFIPGGSIGTTNIVGSAVFGSGSTVEIEFNATSADFIDISGIPGTLTIEPNTTISLFPQIDSFSKEETTYVIINANNGITGTFTNIAMPQILFIPSVIYTPIEAILLIEVIPFSILPTQRNPRAVALCLDSFFPPFGSDLSNILNLITVSTTSIDMLNKILTQFESAFYKGFIRSQENNAIWVRSAISNRIRTFGRHKCRLKPDKREVALWADGYYDYEDQDKRNNVEGYHAHSGAAIVGVDVAITPEFLVGLSGAYSHSSIHWDRSRGKGDIDNGYGVLYGGYGGNMFFANAAFLYARNFYEGKRNINFLTIRRRANNNHQGNQFLGHFDLGVAIPANRFEVTPQASFDYMYLSEEGYRETGAKSLNLKVKRSSNTMLRSEVGILLSRCSRREGLSSQWGLEANYVRESRFSGRTYRQKLVNTPCTFLVRGIKPSRNLFAPGAFVTLFPGKENRGRYSTQKAIPSGSGEADRFYITLSYKGEFGVHYRNHNANLQIGKLF